MGDFENLALKLDRCRKQTVLPHSLNIPGKQHIHLPVTETEHERGVVCIQSGLATGRVQDVDLHPTDFPVRRIAAQSMSLDTVLLQRSHQPIEAPAT